MSLLLTIMMISNVFRDSVNAIIDIFFMADLIINFRSSYINDKTGEEINDIKSIAFNYLKGRFWIDLLASLPIDILSYVVGGVAENSTIFDLIGLLKLVRILRLSRLITYLNMKNELKNVTENNQTYFFPNSISSCAKLCMVLHYSV
jgi:hypothetical protein